MPIAVRKMCQIGGFLLLISICFLTLSVASYSLDDPNWNYRNPARTVQNLGGIVGASMADPAIQMLGSTIFVGILVAGMGAWQIMQARPLAAVTLAWRGSILLTALSTGLHVFFVTDPVFGPRTAAGGLLGRELAMFLIYYVNPFGTYLLLGAAFILALFVGVESRQRVAALGRVWRLLSGYGRKVGGGFLTGVQTLAGAGHRLYVTLRQWILAIARLLRYCLPASPVPGVTAPSATAGVVPQTAEEDWPEALVQRLSSPPEDDPEAFDEAELEPPMMPMTSKHGVGTEAVAVVSQATPSRRSRRQRRPSGSLPSLALLESAPPSLKHLSPEEREKQARFLEQKLRDFGVEGEVVQVLPGPVITMYEFAPAPGIKVSKIVNLQDDLALVMRALSVRVVAPIPGKAVVGIEIPNRQRETVRLRELLDSDAFCHSASKLTLAVGKDILGHPVVTDLGLIPHLLIAGATGSGKSVGLNSMICSLLFRATPADVRMIMIDPKMLELSIYDGIPHLLIPVVTHAKQAAVALRRVVEEMERRYQLLAARGVRSIAQYNQSIEDNQAQAVHDTGSDDASADGLTVLEEKLPYLVVVIDELSDLMMVSSREVEDSLTRIAQMARAAGIHLIVATQRPSVDVLTGVIKANFPARMSFQVSSKTDSRTILDSNGAEKLLGRGDMLFLAPGTSKAQRLHGAYVSETEINRLVSAWQELEQPQYDDGFLDVSNDAIDVEDEEYDEKYDDAVALVGRTGQASISMLQRRLRVGYNRAARMIETMEREGIIGPADGVRPREVLVRKDYDEE